MKDPDRLLKIEKAIQEKYGEETIQNPKNTWDSQKEKEYLQQIKEIAHRDRQAEKIEVDGVLMPKKLFRKESKRTCPVCKTYSFSSRDDLYMVKFNHCFGCWLKKKEKE